MARKLPEASAPLPETVLGLLLAVAGPETAAASIPILRERMNLTPDKLALILLRLLNPDERIEQGEEANLRGIGKSATLKALKDDGLYLREINGCRKDV